MQRVNSYDYADENSRSQWYIRQEKAKEAKMGNSTPRVLGTYT